MKVIDIFKDLADGKEVPYRIKIFDSVYEYSDNDKFYYQNGYSLYRDFYSIGNCLNYEVEIIEEDKEIETLNYQNNSDGSFWLNGKKYNSEPIKILAHKLIELIKAVNELKKGK